MAEDTGGTSATFTNTPISGATFTIHNRSDDSLVKTLTESDLTYLTSGLNPGEYYIKVIKDGYGTHIQHFDAIQGQTESPITFNIIMFPGIDSVPVTVVDKDGADIIDAVVKIANIPGTYDGTGGKYDVLDVPTTTTTIKRLLTVSHANTTYQSISKEVSIQSGVSFPNEVLYPVIDVYIKVYGIKPDSTQVDLTLKSNCIAYNLTEQSTIDTSLIIAKSGGYIKLTNKNDGLYNIVIPEFTTVVDGVNYTVPEIRESLYVDYVSSTDGDVFVDINANLQTQ